MPLVGSFLSRVFSRRVNVRVLLVVVAIGILLGGSVYLVHGVQTRRHADYFLQKAQQAKQDGEIAEAIDHFERYLKLEPEDSDAMAELGLLLADVMPSRKAYEVLERTLLYQPEREDVRRKLADLALKMGRFSDARDHLENRLLVTSPDDSELLEMLARCQAAQGDYQAAADTLEGAVKAAPDRVDFYRYLAELLAKRLEKPDAATHWMDELVEKNPKSPRAHVLRGDYLRSLEKTNEAAEEAAAALKLAPEDLDVLWLAARCALEQGDLETAKKHANKGRELDPKQDRMYIVLADVELKAGDRKKAADWLRQGLEKTPEQPALLRNLALLLIDGGQTDEAQATVEKLRGTEMGEPLLAYLQARIDYLRGDWKTAAERLDRARPDLSRWSDLHRDTEYWLGKCYQHLGATDQQLAAFRRAVAIDRLWLPARLELVDALMAAGQVGEATAEQQRLMKLPGAPNATSTRLAWMLLLDNQRRDPAERNWKDVDKAIDAAAKLDPKAPEIVLLRAEALIGQDRSAEAEKVIRDAIAATPDQVSLWIGLAAYYERQQNWEAAQKLLDDATAKLGDLVALRLARARLLLQHGGDDKAKTLAEMNQLAQPSQKYSEQDTMQLWRGLIPLHLRLGDFEGGLQLCRQAAQKQPNDLPLRLQVFEVSLRVKDQAAVEAALEEIRRIEGKGPFWHYGQAVRLALAAEAAKKKDGLPEALQHLAEAARLRPTWGRVPLLAGQIHDMMGNRIQAAEAFDRAIELGEMDPAAVRRSVQSLYAGERYEEADKLIQRLERQQGGVASGELGRMASDLAMREKDFDRALEMARQNAANSKDPQDYLWLGQVVAILGQRAKNEGKKDQAEKMFTEAEKAFRQAVTMAGEIPQTWIALIHFLSRTGKTEQAEQAIAQAQGKIPANQVPLALAQAYELVGKLPDADAKYREALAAAPNDPALARQVTEYYLRTGRAAEARQQLEKMISGHASFKPADLAWARQRLALVLVAQPDTDRCQRALALIEENLKSPEASLADRRAKAMVLLAAPEGGGIREAIQTMEAITGDAASASPEDRFLLARLYLADDNWPNARKLFQRLAANESRQPRFVAAYVEALIDRGELGNAETWLKTLEEAAPGGFAPASLRAKLAVKRGQADPALAVLEAYIAKEDPAVPQEDDRLRLVASWLEQTARSLDDDQHASQAARLKREAEAMVRRYVQKHPEAELFLIAFLVRNDRKSDALELASRAVEKADTEAIGRMCTVLLEGAAGDDPKHLEKVEALLKAAIEKHQRPNHLLMVLADVTTRRARYDETESIYREVLANQSSNVAALNNLAVLLALRRTHLEEAMELMDKAIDLAGARATLLDSRAMVYIANLQPEKALADLEKAIGDMPRPVRYFHQAQAYFKLGQKEAAAKAFKEAQRHGLKPAQLHPLELPAYQQLEAKLK